jgi:TonB family protein
MYKYARQSKFSLGIALFCIVAACLFLAPTLHAQTADKPDKPTRKVIHKVEADYPLDLQRAHIGGVVRLDVVVSPAGTVDSIAVIGGNPVLVETATRAVKKWKWAPATNATVLRINVNFDADRRSGSPLD